MKISTGKIQATPIKLATSKATSKSTCASEIKKAQLKKASKDFEAYFVLYMLKSMRATIPKSGLFEQGLGDDIYTSMFDEELSKKIAGSSPGSLAELLYKSLEKTLVAEDQGAAAVGTTTPAVTKTQSPSTKASSLTPHQVPASSSTHSVSTQSVNKPPSKVSTATESLPRNSGVKIQSDPILEKYGSSIVEASKRFNVNARLIYSVIAAESGGQDDAISPRGAKGLMQLTDSTAEQMGVSDSLDPHENIVGGTKYLRELLDRYDGDLRLTLAAYNAGPGTVSKFNGVPPYSETQEYVDKVLDRLNSGSQ